MIVNPLGIVEEKINLKEVGYIDFTKMRKIQPTIFSKYGNKIFGLIIEICSLRKLEYLLISSVSGFLLFGGLKLTTFVICLVGFIMAVISINNARKS